MFPPLTELPLILITLGEEVNPIAMELVVFPETEVDVAVGEGVDASAVTALDDLTDVLGAVAVTQLLELGF